MLKRLRNVVSAAIAVIIVGYSFLLLYSFVTSRNECLSFNDPKVIAASAKDCQERQSSAATPAFDQNCLVGMGLIPSRCDTKDPASYVRSTREGAVISGVSFIAFSIIVGSLNYIFFGSFTLWHRRQNIT
jgi:hypothetical protein